MNASLMLKEENVARAYEKCKSSNVEEAERE